MSRVMESSVLESAVLHPDGVVLLRDFLPAPEQVAFVEEVTAFYFDRGPKHHGDIGTLLAKKKHQGRYLLGFESAPEFVPSAFQRWGEAAMDAASQLCEAVPRHFRAVRINSVLYPSTGMLRNHYDNHEGWVVLFSVGCVARFHLQKGDDRAHDLEMASGDVLIFNGSTAHQVYHGVQGIIPGTAPSHLDPMLQQGRIGLQLRGDPEQDVDGG